MQLPRFTIYWKKLEKIYKKRFTFARKTVIIFLVGKQGCIFAEKIKDIIPTRKNSGQRSDKRWMLKKFCGIIF